MSKIQPIQPIRGTHDLLGNKILFYNYVKNIITEMATYYDFNEIETPIFENSELFKKPLGGYSDVVLKEMYTFEDRNKLFLTLRPEYTTPMIRAAISNNLFNQLPLKLFGFGPIFRRERPQKGRYRQFNQINFEILGTSEASADAELIILANEFLQKMYLQEKINSNQKITLQVNSLGDSNTILHYKKVLSEYYCKYKKDLSEDSKIKINTNPLRILDSKHPEDIKINNDSPKIKDYYSKNAIKMFEEVQNYITEAGINFSICNTLVRGLDYYCHTVFEFKSDKLGSQDTIIGGGRYDGLVKTIGGPNIPGVGWASGIERIMMMLENIEDIKPLVQVITINEESKEYALKLVTHLRRKNIKVRYDYKFNIKKSLRNANQENIKFAIIIGESEHTKNIFTVKNLFEGTQQIVNIEELLDILAS